jgi:hypothetical protein
MKGVTIGVSSRCARDRPKISVCRLDFNQSRWLAIQSSTKAMDASEMNESSILPKKWGWTSNDLPATKIDADRSP